MDLKERKLINNTKNDLPKFGLGTTIALEYADDEYNEALLSGELGPNPNKAGATALFNDLMALTGVKPKLNMFKSMIGDAFSKDTLKSAANVGIGVAGNIVGNTAKSLISGDNESVVGNVLGDVTSQLGGALSNVNPILGGIVNVGGGIISGGINALFGSNKKKEQEEKLRRARLQREQELANVKDKEWSSKINNDFMLKYGDLDSQQSLYAAKKGKPSGVNPNTGNTYKKHMVNTAYGKMYRTQNSWLSEGEFVWAKKDEFGLPSFEFGKPGLFKVKEGPNDTARGYIRPGDVVFSKDVINPETGNVVADDVKSYAKANLLERLEYDLMLGNLMGYNKNNNMYALNIELMPKYRFGNIASTVFNLGAARQLYKEASKPLRYPDIYAPNEQFGTAMSQLDGLRMDYYPVIAQNKNIESATKYNIRRSGGLSTGQKMLLGRQLAYDTLRNNADVFFKNALQNNQYRQLAAQERMRAGQDAARMKIQANMFNEDMLAKAHNAALQGKQMAWFNAANAIQQYYRNNWQDKTYRDTLSMYRDDLDERKAERIAKYNNIIRYA